MLLHLYLINKYFNLGYEKKYTDPLQVFDYYCGPKPRSGLRTSVRRASGDDLGLWGYSFAVLQRANSGRKHHPGRDLPYRYTAWPKALG